MADIKQTQEAIDGLPDGEPLYFPRSVGSGFANAVIDSDSIKAFSARLTAMETALERIKTRMQQFREYTVEENLIVMWLDKWIEEELPNINQVLEGK